MDGRNVLFLFVVSLLLFGTACAQKTVNDFEIDESYAGAYNGSYHSLYLNQNLDSGIAIYKIAAGDVDEDDDAHENLIHDDGRDYMTPDDDMKIDKNSDNTFNFTDYDHGQHGVGELIDVDGDSYVVAFFEKGTGSVDCTNLISQLSQFNKDNDVDAVAF